MDGTDTKLIADNLTAGDFFCRKTGSGIEILIVYKTMISTGPLQLTPTPPTSNDEKHILAVDFNFRYHQWRLGGKNRDISFWTLPC